VPNWVAVMMAIMHIRVERSDWNDVAIEVINFPEFRYTIAIGRSRDPGLTVRPVQIRQ
jgi:hypothetical protein